MALTMRIWRSWTSRMSVGSEIPTAIWQVSAVVEPADDLHIGTGSAVGMREPVVGEVGLPGLVRHLGLEPDVGGLRSPSRFGGGEIVERDTTRLWFRARCQAMVSGPASKPAVLSFSRRSRTSSTVAGASAVGEVLGHLDRG